MNEKDVPENNRQRVHQLESDIKALKTDRDHLEKIISSLDTGLSLINSDGTISWVNKKIREMFPGENPIGQICHRFYESSDEKCVPCPTFECFQSGSVHEVERFNPANGRWYRIISQPMKDIEGKVINVLERVTDITEGKQAEKALIESERNLRQAQAIGKIGNWSWDITADNATWSDQVYEIFKAPKEEPSYEFAKSFVHPEDLSFWQNTVQMAVEKEQPFSMNYRAIRSDGETIWVHNETQPVHDEKGTFTGYVGTVQDITEQKKTTEILEKRNTDLKLAQRIASIGNWTLDPEVGVPQWSEEVYRIYERDPSLGPYPLSEYKNIYKGKWFERFHSAIQSAISDGTPYDIELKLEFESGKEKWIHAICEPEPEVGPKGHKVRGTIQDITEKRRAEETLRQSQKMEAIGTLAGGIAHEFNNMLGVIIGNTELAIDDIPEWSPAADCIQEIRTASLRAKDVVRKLLSVARKAPESRKPIQICTIVNESLKLIRKTTPSSIEVRSNLACTTETILADPTEINQVLLNLCTNSVHAMSDGKGVLEVTLDTITLDSPSSDRFENIGPGDYVKLTVSDDGKGMVPDIMDRIFEPYFTTKEVDQGLGMGLAVVHGIVKKNDGDIKVQSAVGKGTTVEVLFPLIEGQPVPSHEEIEALPTGTERILFVDDEASLVRMATQMLTRSGYEVVGKTSSASALKEFEENPERFDLVITDMTMPEMTGDELAREIIQVRPDIPIILCTGHSDHMDENKAKRMGIKAFAMKPLVKADLTKTVRKVLDEAKSVS